MGASKDNSQSIFLGVLAKFAVVMSKTKDALIADLKERLLKDTGEELNYKEVNKIVDNLFKLLGYDVSGLIPKEISDATDQAFSLTEDIHKTVAAIAKIVDDEDNFPDIFDEPPSSEIDDIFVGTYELIQNTVELIKTFKKMGDMQLDKSAADWERFVSESNLQKDLPGRIFDQVIASFMRNVVAVFAEDVEELKKFIESEIKKVTGELQKSLSELNELLGDLLKDIFEKGVEEALKTIGRNLKESLKIVVEVLKQDLGKELNEKLTLLKNFLKIEEHFTRVYAVLDFMQVISLEKVEIFSLKTGNDTVSLTSDIYVIHWKRMEEMIKNPFAYFQVRYPVNSINDAEELIAELIRIAQAFGLDIPDFDSLKSMLIDLLRRLEKWVQDNITSVIKDKINEIITVIKNFLMMLEQMAIQVTEKIEKELGTVFDSIVSEVKTIYKEIASQTKPLSQLKLEMSSGISKDTRELVKSIDFISFPGEDEIKASFNKIVLPAILDKASEYKEFGAVTAEDWKKLVNNTGSEVLSIFKEVKSKISEFSAKDFAAELKKEIISALEKEFKSQTENIPKDWNSFKSKVITNPENLRPDKIFSKFDLYAYFLIIAEKLEAAVDFLNPEAYYDKVKKASDNAIAAIVKTSDETAKNFKSNVENQSADEVKKIFTSFMSNVLIECWKELRKELFERVLEPFFNVIEAVSKAKAKDILTEVMKNFAEFKEVKTLLNEIPAEYKDFSKEVFPVIYDSAQNGVDDWKDGLKLAVKLGKEIYKLVDKVIETQAGSSGSEASEEKADIRQAVAVPDSVSSGEMDKLTWNVPDFNLDEKNKFVSITLYDSREKDKDKKKKEEVKEEKTEVAKGEEKSEEKDKDKKKSDNFFTFSLCAFIGEKKDKDEDEEDDEDKDKSKEKGSNKDKDKEKDKDKDKSEAETGVFFLPVLQGNFEKSFDIGKNHALMLILKALLNAQEDDLETEKLIEKLQKGSIGLFISKSSVEVLADTDSVSVEGELNFKRKDTTEPISLIKSKYLDFTIEDYPQGIALGYKDSEFFFKYEGEVKKAELVLKLRSMNDFFAELLKDDLTGQFGMKLLYDTREGFSFDGSASVKLEFNKEVKISDAFTLHGFGIEAGLKEGLAKVIKAEVSTSFTVNFKQVVFYVENLGFGLNMNYLKEDGSLGDFDISPSFKFPTGMGVTIDAAAVKGSGLISYKQEEEEFFGALELSILEKIEVKAMALLNLKLPDGEKGFSFIGLISAYFTPGIPIGMGFSLTGVGGVVGLNRKIERDKIQQGVRQGELGALLFVKDIEEHFDTMVTQIGNYFPVKTGQFFFAVLGRITFAEILHVEMGLMIQAPSPFEIIIVGGLFVALPTKKEALIRINVYFAGGINFEEGIWFDASIVDSEIVGIEISGDMAFRLFWGKNKGFLLSAGGFHPAYTPDEGLNVGTMQRLCMKLDYTLVKLSLEAYFAITSNSVQFGAQVDIRIGWKSVGLFGYFGFDCLFQFSPFRFLFDVRMGVEARWGKWKLFAVHLSFALSGPAEWNAKGDASFTILFFTFKVGFNITWGKKHLENEISYISIYELLQKEYHNINNWGIITSEIADEQVFLVERTQEDKELILQPYDGVMFEQSVIPFDAELEKFGEGILPSDYTKVVLSKMDIGDLEFDELDKTFTDFAPSLFFELNEKEKLSRPSYEEMFNGVRAAKGLSDRDVSRVFDGGATYNVEQDIISFTNDGKSFTKTENEVTKTLKSSAGTSNRASTSTESVVDSFNKYSMRTDSGFQHEVNRYRQFQRTSFNEKVGEFLDK